MSLSSFRLLGCRTPCHADSSRPPLSSSEQQTQRRQREVPPLCRHAPNPANYSESAKSTTSQADPADLSSESTGRLFYVEVTLTRIQLLF